MCLDIYWAIFLDGHAFVAQDKGEAISNLDGLVASLYRNTMPALISVSYGDLIGQTEPQTKKRNTLDSGLNLEGRDAGGLQLEPKTAYGVVNHPNAILNAKWAKLKGNGEFLFPVDGEQSRDQSILIPM